MPDSIILYEFKEPLWGLRKQRRSFNRAEAEVLDTFYGHLGKDTRSDLTEEEAGALEKILERLRDTYKVDDTGTPLSEYYQVVRRPSEKYPKHSFKVGHFWSSHTPKGLDNVLRARIGKDLNDTFATHDASGHFFQPDWEASLQRAREMLSDFKSYIEENGHLEIFEVSYNPFKDLEKEPVNSFGKALEAFTSEKKERGHIINSAGYFFPKGLTVLGIVEGKSISGQEAQYVVYEGDLNTYVKALEIVVETCEWVLQQDGETDFVLGLST